MVGTVAAEAASDEKDVCASIAGVVVPWRMVPLYAVARPPNIGPVAVSTAASAHQSQASYAGAGTQAPCCQKQGTDPAWAVCTALVCCLAWLHVEMMYSMPACPGHHLLDKAWHFGYAMQGRQIAAVRRPPGSDSEQHQALDHLMYTEPELRGP